MTLRSRTASCTSATELSRATARGRTACGNRIVSRSGRSPSSAGTSARFTSCTPPDSKSGLRSLSLIVLVPSALRSAPGLAPREHALQEGAAAVARLGLAQLQLRALLAGAAAVGERQRLEPRRLHLRAAILAQTVGARLQAVQGLVDLGQGLGLPLPQGEVQFLH